jgi:hypothetical protein
MKISNAFAKTTAKGHKVYRIMVDTNEILSYLEQGRKLIGIDIMTNAGLVKIIKGTKGTKAWEALQYYVWGTVAKEERKEVERGEPSKQ